MSEDNYFKGRTNQKHILKKLKIIILKVIN